ncbi:Smr/MutS family protein [Psychromarinibacter sp. C21-152]|uniref:Smr/MutS family protein n=1 Tax=Psychromarinibacter sediminicola TaxID=3033385 RepID=A0AAE3NSN3_9RHOB|nr:Smr/MutS family protein [Psychromarinibacter sediminicola]MDF0601291.1 Smr/MutS family protein [Psychromarinibacter sediminicola]
MTKRPRKLTADEQALWNRIADQTAPLHPKRKTQTAAEAVEQPKPQPQTNGIPAFRIGEKRTDTALPHDLAPGIGEHLHAQPVRMDRKAHTRMRRGKLEPEARIDLHGMTLDRAHPALTRFIMNAHAQDRRLVLVITGKGRSGGADGPMPERRGVLKHQVPQWLHAPPLRQLVLQVTEAHMKHGGTGAYYVYLRRRR